MSRLTTPGRSDREPRRPRRGPAAATLAPGVPLPRAGTVVPVLLAVCSTMLPPIFCGALAVQLDRHVGVDPDDLGLAVAVFFAAGAACSPLCGRLGERLGAARSLRIGAGVTMAATLAIAGLVSTFGSLVVFLVIAGAGNALVQPAANSHLAQSIDAGRLGLANALKQSAAPVCTILGGVAVPTIALTVGWRWAFAGGALLALVAIATVPDAPRRRPPAAGDRGDAPLVPMIVLAAAAGFGAASVNTLATFSVASATHAGIGNGAAGILIAVGSFVGVSTRISAGVRADRRAGSNLLIVWRMLAFGAVLYLCLALGTPLAFYIGIPIAYATSWGWPALFQLAVVRRNPRAPGAATAIIQTGSYAGAVIGPVLFGWLAARSSYAAGWVMSATFSLTAACLVAWGRRLLLRLA